MDIDIIREMFGLLLACGMIYVILSMAMVNIYRSVIFNIMYKKYSNTSFMNYKKFKKFKNKMDKMGEIFIPFY